jgi:hypothetical protein
LTASCASPFPPGCGGPGEASASSVVYQNAEVETHVAVNPTNASNVVAFWQQDRWSHGGAIGNNFNDKESLAQSSTGTIFHPAWVAANDGNLANRTDVFHRTAG